MPPPSAGDQLQIWVDSWSSHTTSRGRHATRLFKCLPMSARQRAVLPVCLQGFAHLGREPQFEVSARTALG